MKFTIDRSKWRCGFDFEHARGIGDTQLRNDKQFMCCLGQVALQCGVTDSEIAQIGIPSDIKAETLQKNTLLHILVHFTESGRIIDSAFASKAMDINDDHNLSDSEREAKLTTLFAEHGHEIEFVGEYVIPIVAFVIEKLAP